MSSDMKKYFCPRLIDFVIIVGCKEPATPAQLIAKHLHQQQLNEQSIPPEYRQQHNDINKNPPTQLPELLRRYPLDDHNDFMLPQDVTFFCQPEGCTNINCSNQQRANANRDTTSFIFSLTEKDSARVRYGVCINFFRPIEKKNDHHHKKSKRNSLNKTSNSTENQAASKHDNETDDEVHSANSNRKANTSAEHDASKLKKKRNKKASDVKYTHTLTSLCIISHHPFFSLFRECLNILRKIIEACHARSVASKPGTPTNSSAPTSASNKTNHRDTVWGILTGSSGTISTDQISSLVACEIREIETWILRLLSAPVPIPGKTKLIIDILPNEPPMLFALPDHTRFNLVDFPLHLPLELLGVDLCIKVFTLILLENKVLFQSSDYNALTMSIMAFVSMLYPLEYMFPVIPLLPRCMNETEQLLLAPTPFIIGVPASFFQYKNNIILPDDVWLVDLDKNKIIPARHGEPIPELPEPEHSVLKNHLNQALASLSSSPQPVKNFEVFFNQQSTALQNVQSNKEHLDIISKSFNPLIYGNDVDSVDVATRITMVQFFNSKNTLGNFNEHTRTLRLYPRPVVAFQYNSFIRSRPVKSSFIIKLAKTQAVEFLAEWSLCPSNVSYLRIQTGIFDPSLIGDKPKWYCRYLTPIQFKTYEEKSTLASAIQFLNQEASKGKSGAEESPTDESLESELDDDSYSISSLDDISNSSNTPFEKRQIYTADGKPLGMFPKHQASTMCVDVVSVYQPPVDSDFKDLIERSPSAISSNAESSPMTSSASSSSINSETNNDHNDSFNDKDEEDEENSHFNPDFDDDNAFINNAEIEINSDPSTINYPSIQSKKIKPLSILIHEKKLAQANDSKSSSATITPVNKNFPKPVFDNQLNSSIGTESESMSSLNSPAAHDQLKQKPRTDSQSSLTNRLLNKTSQSPRNKPSSFALISQLSDDIFSDMATKAKNLTSIATANISNKKFSNILSDESQLKQSASLMTSSLSSLSIKTDTNNNSTNKFSYEAKKLPEFQTPNMSSTSSAFNLNFTPGRTTLNVSPLVQSQAGDSPSSQSDSENQIFLKEVLVSVLEGQGVGWLKFNRIKRLMEDENYRNFLLSRLNTSLDNKLSNDEEHIEDVKVSKAVFKGMAKLLSAIIHGLEQTYANNGLGGMASAFQLLEIAHSHYWVRGTESAANSKTGQTDGTMSPMSEHSNSPYESKENLSHVANQSGASSANTLQQSSSVHGLNLMSSQQQQANSGFQIQTTGSIVAQLGKPTLNTDSGVKRPSSLEKTSDEQAQSKASLKPKINHHSINPQAIPASEEDLTLSDAANLNKLDIAQALPNSKTSSSISPSMSSSQISSLKMVTSSTSHSINSRNFTNLSMPVAKSQLTSGYRYTKGILVQVAPQPSSNNASPSAEHTRTYLFETIVNNPRSPLWDQMQFWEDVFLDAVSQERDIIGLDQGPSEMMERYSLLGGAEKKRLELDEDHLLAVMLYNLIAFMIMMRVSKDEIKRKVRRMLGKCHIGLLMSQQVNDLLDSIAYLSGNDVDLRPAGSRLMQKQSFTVHLGTDNKGDMLFMEVCDDCMILRSVKGEIRQRWWFEKLVNMTYCPKTKVLCLWCKNEGETELNKFYTKKCRELYFSIKEAMEKAVTRLNNNISTQSAPNLSELGGEFQIFDLKTNQEGVLEICMDGIKLTFNNEKEFIELKRVRKCTTQKDDIFVMEEFNPKAKQIVVRKYKSTMVS